MNVGTKSLLYGVHQVFIHPIMLLIAWARLFGWGKVRCEVTGVRTFLFDPRLWLVAFAHDLGYWGCPEMDGPTGKWHPVLGSRLVSAVLGERCADRKPNAAACYAALRSDGYCHGHARRLANGMQKLGPWGLFTLLHSRSICRRLACSPSLLAAADKLAGPPIYPKRLYLMLAVITGELEEYMRHGRSEEGEAVGVTGSSPGEWFDSVSAYMERVARSIAEGMDTEPPPAEP